MSESRVILVTGGSAGIGWETALAFARRGDRVGATGRRADRLDALNVAAKDLPGAILPLVADVTSAVDMQRAIAELVTAYGRLDVLVANAGLGQRGSIVDSKWDDLEAVLRTNIDGVLHSVRAAVPEMRKAGGGHVVTVSSVLGVAIGPYCAVYSASKTALNALARGLRAELQPDHIWVTNLLVGQTVSEFSAARRGVSGKVASRLPGMPTERVANAIVRATTQRRRTVTLRLIDRAIVAAGEYAPWFMDRLLARVYKV